MLHRNLRCERQGEGKTCPLLERADHPDPAAEQFDDAPADVQAEPAAVGTAGGRSAALPEFVENQILVLARDPRAVVAHLDAQVGSARYERDLDPAALRVAELCRVREQVEHYLHDPVEVR